MSIYDMDLGYMGKYAGYRPGALNPHKIVNDLFGLPSRRAFAAGAVVVQQKKIPDVSFYQAVINYELMRLQTDALVIRAGQNTWIDTQFVRNWVEAKRKGIKRGSYYFYDDRVSPGKQADLWVSLLKDDLPEMEIWCDWENTYGGAYGGLQNVVAFMQAVEAKLPGIKIGLYSGYYWFRGNSNAVTNASQYNYLKTRPLWLAWYTTNPANVLIPNPWTSLFMWQFGTPSVGHDYGVGTIELDMNYINMTEAEFQQRYGGVVVPPVEEPVIEDKYFRVTAGALNVRTSANSSSPDNKVSTLLAGDIIHAVAVTVAGGVTWHQIDGGRYWRGAAWHPFPTASVTGEYWTAEKGSAVWMVETTNPQPPTGGTPFTLAVDGYKPFSGELTKE